MFNGNANQGVVWIIATKIGLKQNKGRGVNWKVFISILIGHLQNRSPKTGWTGYFKDTKDKTRIIGTKGT